MYDSGYASAGGRFGDAGDSPREPESPRSLRYERSASGRLRSESGRLPPAWHPWSPSQRVSAFGDATFEVEVLDSTLPVVVDFWAETCIPCRRHEPTLERLAEHYAGRLRVGRLNVYDNPLITERYQVKGVPHLLVIREREVVLELVGDHSFEQLDSRLRSRGLV